MLVQTMNSEKLMIWAKALYIDPNSKLINLHEAMLV